MGSSGSGELSACSLRDFLHARNQLAERVVRFFHRGDPALAHPGNDDLVEDGVAELGLVLEMVVDGAFGQPGPGENRVEPRWLEAVLVDLGEGGVDQPLARGSRGSVAGLLHPHIIPIGMNLS